MTRTQKTPFNLISNRFASLLKSHKTIGTAILVILSLFTANKIIALVKKIAKLIKVAQTLASYLPGFTPKLILKSSIEELQAKFNSLSAEDKEKTKKKIENDNVYKENLISLLHQKLPSTGKDMPLIEITDCKFSSPVAYVTSVKFIFNSKSEYFKDPEREFAVNACERFQDMDKIFASCIGKAVEKTEEHLRIEGKGETIEKMDFNKENTMLDILLVSYTKILGIEIKDPTFKCVELFIKKKQNNQQ